MVTTGEYADYQVLFVAQCDEVAIARWVCDYNATRRFDAPARYEQIDVHVGELPAIATP